MKLRVSITLIDKKLRDMLKTKSRNIMKLNIITNCFCLTLPKCFWIVVKRNVYCHNNSLMYHNVRSSKIKIKTVFIKKKMSIKDEHFSSNFFLAASIYSTCGNCLLSFLFSITTIFVKQIILLYTPVNFI